jgi:Tol biopolymer transport system component
VVARWEVRRLSQGRWAQNRPLFSINPDFELAYSEQFPAFSHDGKHLVVASPAGLPGFESALNIMNPDGLGSKRLFYEKGSSAYFPEWSPDDQWILVGVGAYFGTERNKPARVMMVRADGSETRELTRNPPNAGFPSSSPDGTRVVYRVWGKEEHGLRILNLKDASISVLTTGYDNFPAWSPSGDLISFTGFRNDDFDILHDQVRWEWLEAAYNSGGK